MLRNKCVEEHRAPARCFRRCYTRQRSTELTSTAADSMPFVPAPCLPARRRVQPAGTVNRYVTSAWPTGRCRFTTLNAEDTPAASAFRHSARLRRLRRSRPVPRRYAAIMPDARPSRHRHAALASPFTPEVFPATRRAFALGWHAASLSPYVHAPPFTCFIATYARLAVSPTTITPVAMFTIPLHGCAYHPRTTPDAMRASRNMSKQMPPDALTLFADMIRRYGSPCRRQTRHSRRPRPGAPRPSSVAAPTFDAAAWCRILPSPRPGSDIRPPRAANTVRATSFSTSRTASASHYRHACCDAPYSPHHYRRASCPYMPPPFVIQPPQRFVVSISA